MKILSEKTKTLLLMGSKTTGTLTEGLEYVIEELYIDEILELRKFCEYVDNKIGGCSSANIDMLFKAFKNPNDKIANANAESLRKRIEQIKSYSKF